jgi:hypothetical protein
MVAHPLAAIRPILFTGRIHLLEGAEPFGSIVKIVPSGLQLGGREKLRGLEKTVQVPIET